MVNMPKFKISITRLYTDKKNGPRRQTSHHSLVRLDMVNHIADLAGFDRAQEATQKLVGPAGHLVDFEALREAHVAGIRAESIPNSALRDGFLQRTVAFAACKFDFLATSQHRLAWIKGLHSINLRRVTYISLTISKDEVRPKVFLRGKNLRLLGLGRHLDCISWGGSRLHLPGRSFELLRHVLLFF